MKVKFTITNDTANIFINGVQKTVHKSATTWKQLLKALAEERWHDVEVLVDTKKALNKWSKGDFRVENETVLYKNVSLPKELNSRIIKMLNEGQDPSVLTKFWEKLQKNPSYRSVEQLFSFLVHEGIPLTPDGDILAYKSVKSDFYDHYSGQNLNTVGSVHEMPRNQISDDPNHACHQGLHVGSLEYAKDFHGGENIIICKVNPENVVCVPYDCNSQKVRVSKYEVVGLFGSKLPSTVFSKEEFDDKDYNDVEDVNDVEDIDEIFSSSYDDEDYDDEDYDDEDYDDEGEYAIEEEKNPSFDSIDMMTEYDLRTLSMKILRSYASNHLKIVGASRIPGGKEALIERILQVKYSKRV